MKTTHELRVVTVEAVKARAMAEGFDVCGIAPASELPELEYLSTWLKKGYAGEMHYMHRSAERRTDVRHVLPSAQSVIVLGTVYNVSRPYSTENADPRQAGIARYAWGDDYHDVIGERMARLMQWLAVEVGPGFEGRAYIDTGPVQERVYARHAGLGWIAKNTCVINPDLGSWLFLSEIICNVPLRRRTHRPSISAARARCASTRALQGLSWNPTSSTPTVVSRISPSSSRDRFPKSCVDDIGEHAYGCDICQEVCPWNLTPGTATSADRAWLPRAGLDGVPLLDLWRKSDTELRTLLKGSAMKRAGVKRLRRNLAVAIGNSGEGEAVASLRGCDQPTAQDPLVQHHVEWAMARLQGKRDHAG